MRVITERRTHRLLWQSDGRVRGVRRWNGNDRRHLPGLQQLHEPVDFTQKVGLMSRNFAQNILRQNELLQRQQLLNSRLQDCILRSLEWRGLQQHGLELWYALQSPQVRGQRVDKDLPMGLP